MALSPLDLSQRLVVVGPPQPLDPTLIGEALLALWGLGQPVVLELAAGAAAVEVAALHGRAQRLGLERALRGAAPHWDSWASPRCPLAPRPLQLVCFLSRPGVPDWAPLRELGALTGVDFLVTALEAVQPLGADERLVIRYLFTPAGPARRARARRGLTVPLPPASASDLLADLLQGSPRAPRFEARLQRALEARLDGPLFEVAGSIALLGPDAARLTERGRSLGAVFATRLDGGFGGLRLEPWHRCATPAERAALAHIVKDTLLLTPGELGVLWHPLAGGAMVPGATYVRRPSSPLPPAAREAGGLVLGTHRQRGAAVPVHLPLADLLAGHVVVPGKTGVGKSTLLHQLVRALAARPDRPSLVVLDPHGDLVRDIAQRSIPAARVPDTLLLDFGDTDFPIGLPLFAAPPDVPHEVRVDSSFAILKLIFREHWSPTRMEDVVYGLTVTLCALPDATVLDVPRLLLDAAFRRRAVAQLQDPVAREFWADFELLSEAGRREVARPVLYRLRAFYRAAAIRHVVCQTQGPDFPRLLDQGSILLVSLAGQAIAAEADLLGELLVAQLHLGLLARLARPPAARRPVVMAVDESQRFSGASLPILLREGRKLGVGLVLATQYLDAWGEALAQSVLGTVGTLVAFRCGPSDSRRLAASVKPFTPDQLEDLDRHEALVKLQVEGRTLGAVDVQTLPLTAPADAAALDRIRAQTRARYARPRREIEAALERPPTTTISRGWEAFDVD